MTIDEKAGKTLEELGVRDAAGVEALFAEVRAAMEAERQALVSQSVIGEPERQRVAKGKRDRWLGRKNGLLARVDEHWLRAAPNDLRPSVGRLFNELRKLAACFDMARLVKDIPLQALDYIYDDYPARLLRPQRSDTEQAQIAARRAIGVDDEFAPLDLTLPGYRRPLGSIHPVTRVQREIEDIFLNLGFSIETGPEIESVYYNFDALNIPESHPSRDDWDTLYIDAKTVLRTHTSPVQIRAMEKSGAPLYIIVPGKCYRHDNPDATHSPMFHQIEGLAVDTDITFADLKGTLDFFAKKFFGEKVRTSFRPSFFPFTEPSGEVAVSCIACDGQGCRVCKQSGWIEVMGCGMVHPEVLRNCRIDPDRYSGWAFGLGVDRFAMAKYDINDIQLFFQSDLRFLEQF
jgi:phenylalanyl-tRNA synthetase alpha chain